MSWYRVDAQHRGIVWIVLAGLVALILLVLSLATTIAALAQNANFVLVARITIYPRDIISNDMIEERPVSDQVARTGFYTRRDDIVGRVSRQTLLAGQTIGAGAIEEPRAVSIGAPVKLIYSAPGLVIAASGMALQSGVIGDRVRVRNVDSGIVIQGTVARDGSVVVGDS